MRPNNSRFQATNLAKGSRDVCTKCKIRGRPRRGHFDRKPLCEKKKLIAQRPVKYPIATHQLAATVIQKYARTFVVRVRRAKYPSTPDQWHVQCVHYLSKRGPYGQASTIQGRRVPVYKVIAANAIQTAWRNHSWERRIKYLGVDGNEVATIIQTKWRSVVCRAYFLIIRNAVANPKVIETLVIGQPRPVDELMFCIDGSLWPLSILYKPADGTENPWQVVDKQRLAQFTRKKIEQSNKRMKARKCSTVNKRSTKKDVKELKLEKIRKKSQLKWRWFYEDKENSCVPCWTEEEEHNGDSVKIQDTVAIKNDDNDDTDDAVMSWLTNLDLEEDKI